MRGDDYLSKESSFELFAVHIRANRGRFVTVDPEFDAIRTGRGQGYRWVL